MTPSFHMICTWLFTGVQSFKAVWSELLKTSLNYKRVNTTYADEIMQEWTSIKFASWTKFSENKV
jgi:hypothetical protein